METKMEVVNILKIFRVRGFWGVVVYLCCPYGRCGHLVYTPPNGVCYRKLKLRILLQNDWYV